MSRLIWWLFDHTPRRFQDRAEAWARTLVVRRAPGYREAVEWARSRRGEDGEP